MEQREPLCIWMLIKGLSRQCTSVKMHLKQFQGVPAFGGGQIGGRNINDCSFSIIISIT